MIGCGNEAGSKNMKKLFFIALVSLLFGGCVASDRAALNIRSMELSLQISQRVTVFNLRHNAVLFQIEGKIRVEKDGGGDLKIIGKDFVHYASLPGDVAWVSEQLVGVDMPDGYRFIILPLQSVSIKMED
jgi:hypothetical protein